MFSNGSENVVDSQSSILVPSKVWYIIYVDGVMVIRNTCELCSVMPYKLSWTFFAEDIEDHVMWYRSEWAPTCD
jgi:hypothetical protein